MNRGEGCCKGCCCVCNSGYPEQNQAIAFDPCPVSVCKGMCNQKSRSGTPLMWQKRRFNET